MSVQMKSLFSLQKNFVLISLIVISFVIYMFFTLEWVPVLTQNFNIKIATTYQKNEYKLGNNNNIFVPHAEIKDAIPTHLTQDQIFNYIKNITHIEKQGYLSLLRTTVDSNHFNVQSIKINSRYLIPEELHLKYDKAALVNNRKVPFPFLTALPNGGMGNRMGEYATLLALGKLYNVSVFLHPTLSNRLKKIFPHLSMEKISIKVVKKLKCKIIKRDALGTNYSPIQVAAAGLFGRHCFVIKGYPFEMQLFNIFKEQIIKEFTFSNNVLKQVEDYFSSIQNKSETNDKTRDSNKAFIGVHVRRTGYINFIKKFGGTLPTNLYVKNALNYYRMKYSNAIFIASSDDMKYIQTILANETDIYFSPGNNPVTDMAILSSCNHSIFTVGTFGFWTGYLTGGEVVYADIQTRNPFKHKKYFFTEANLTNFKPLPPD